MKSIASRWVVCRVSVTAARGISGASLKPLVCRLVLVASALMLDACSQSSTAPSTTTTTAPAPAPAPSTSTFTTTFEQNPAPFRSTGCSFVTPAGWYTNVRVQETANVAFNVTGLTQKLDGNTVSFLAESFGSRFGACSGAPFTPDMILGNGAVCATIGVCTSGSYGTYQFSIAGTDANGRAVTLDSPVLQLGGRPAGQSIPVSPRLLISRPPEAAAAVGERR